jgi:hypothetical protein
VVPLQKLVDHDAVKKAAQAEQDAAPSPTPPGGLLLKVGPRCLGRHAFS